VVPHRAAGPSIWCHTGQQAHQCGATQDSRPINVAGPSVWCHTGQQTHQCRTVGPSMWCHSRPINVVPQQAHQCGATAGPSVWCHTGRQTHQCRTADPSMWCHTGQQAYQCDDTQCLSKTLLPVVKYYLQFGV